MDKPTKQEVEDLIKYCSDKERTVPVRWIEVMSIIEYEKQPRNIQKTLQCSILGAYWNTSKENKVKRFHDQIKFAGYFSSNREKVFYELKDFLHNLSEEEWKHQELPLQKILS